MTIVEGPHQERTENVVETPRPAAPVEVVRVVDRVDTSAPVSANSVRTTSGSRFAPDAVIAAAVGLVLAVLGLVVVIRGGFSGPMSLPVVTVLGFTHTATLGLIEIGLGTCLLISGAMKSRPGAMLFGGALGVAGFVGAIQVSSFETSLALEAAMGWLALVAGALVVLAALVLPRYARSSSTLRRDTR